MAQRINRRNVIRGLGAAGIAGLAGCTGDGGGDGDSGDDDTTTESGGGGGGDTTTTESDGGGSMDRTIKQGVLLPTTGDLADLGGPIRNGAILPQTVLEGETDFELDFSVQDTQTDPNAAQSAAQSLRAGGYPAVTGAASSEVTISVAENVFIPSGMVGCSPASTSPAISGLEDNGLIYRTPPTCVRRRPRFEDRSSLTNTVRMRPSPVSKNRWVCEGSSRFGCRITSGIPSRSR